MRLRRLPSESLRFRLPVLVSGLIFVVLTPFLAVAYFQLQSTLIRAGGDRAQGSADQLANLFAQTSQQRLSEVERVAANPAVRQYLLSPTPDNEQAARLVLRPLATTGQHLIELWNADGRRALAIAVPATADAVLPAGTPRFTPGTGPMRSIEDRVFSEVVAAVPGERGQTGQERNGSLGHLVARRLSTAPTTSDVLGRLVGAGASVTIGNQGGGVWTDLSRIVPAPPGDLSKPGVIDYARADGTRRLAALSPVRGTPWAVSVDFPRALVVRPATTFVRGLGIAAAVFLLASIALTTATTRRITTPLADLTAAAESIAAGDYSNRVSVPRRDEIGRLAQAFNRMTEQVETSRQRLETQARALAASQETAQRQKTILESVLHRMRDGVAVADPTGHFILSNKPAEEIIGIGATDGNTGAWLETHGAFHPDGVTPFPSDELPLARAIAGIPRDDVEMLIRNAHRPDGVLINCYGRPLFDSTGTLIGGVAIFEDITERHRTETALRNRERDFRTLFADSPLPGWVYDQETLRFLEVNDAAVRHYGYSRDEFLSMTIADIRPEEDVPALLADVAQPRTAWKQPTYWRHRQKSGRIIDVEITTHNLTFDNRAAVMVVAHDITERRQVERALVESEAHKTTVVNASLDCIVTMDHDGRITEFNPAAESTFGYSRDEAIGRRLADLLIPERLREQHRRALERYVATGERHVIGRRLELPALRKDGTEFPAEVSILAVHQHGPPLFTGFIRDLTEQKAADQARIRTVRLEEENLRVQEASRLKSEFLANMSHELRTPLNAIIGFAELLHDDQVTPEMPEFKEFHRDILTSGQHLLQLINDVLDLSKVEAGRLDFYPEPTDVEHTITEVLGILRTAAADKQLRVGYDVHPDVRRVTIDRGRFKQVLYNYLSNAMKFTPADGRIRVHVTAEGEDRFRLEVEDSGIGIAADDIGRLFIEFQQLEPGSSKKHQGTGLGLALTKRLVEAQGGIVGVRSTPGVGSVFFAVFPRRADKGTPIPGPRSFPAAHLDAPSVLVIEDNQRDQDTLVRSLTSAGYTVETASTGAQALAQVAERSFDAITLDLLLPDASGVDVLRAIRANERNRDVPVIVITVVSSHGVVNGYAVQDILTKPVDGDELLASLRRAGLAEPRGTVLVVDDDPGSLRLMEASLGQLGYQSACFTHAPEALRAAEHGAPRVVVLDLIMPEMDGFEFLTRFREIPHCQCTPVIVWTVKDLSRDDYARLGSSVLGIMAKAHTGATSVVDELRRFIPPLKAS